MPGSQSRRCGLHGSWRTACGRTDRTLSIGPRHQRNPATRCADATFNRIGRFTVLRAVAPRRWTACKRLGTARHSNSRRCDRTAPASCRCTASPVEPLRAPGRPRRALRVAQHARSFRSPNTGLVCGSHTGRRDLADHAPGPKAGADATARPRPAVRSPLRRKHVPRIRRGSGQDLDATRSPRSGVCPGKGILGRVAELGRAVAVRRP
jgi:hypothetical protein